MKDYILPLLVALGIVTLLYSLGNTNELKEYLSTFIPVNCCYTNDCCWKISEKDVIDLGNMKYKIVATGQEIYAKFSPDGEFWRCACDKLENNWFRHLLSSTRCLFVPMRSF